MMAEKWVISDLHLAHARILEFEHDGKPLRPFKSLEEMHAEIVKRWNAVVAPQDKVYVLGDVVFAKWGFEVLGELNGKKRLIMGNHDGHKPELYRQYFQKIDGARSLYGFWMTHVPMHPDTMDRARLNVHGHLHANVIDDPRYVNVSVEQIDYTPLSFDVLEKKAQELGR